VNKAVRGCDYLELTMHHPLEAGGFTGYVIEVEPMDVANRTTCVLYGTNVFC
jgi:hypothetical protein